MEEHGLLKKEKNMKGGDRISQLPDNILGTILSFLTMRDAVRTSVLSSRWRYLWTTSISNLHLDVDNMLEREEYSDINFSEIGSIQQLIIPWKRMLNFINSVQQFLLQFHPDHKIDKLKVRFRFCRNKYGSHLDKWIHFAISKGVNELELDLSEQLYFDVPDNGQVYDFPCDVLLLLDPPGRMRPSLKCLRLTSCILTPTHPYFTGFNLLTTLDLKCVHFLSDEHVQHLLSNCLLLEWLSFYRCAHLVHLKIKPPFANRLKFLNAAACCNLQEIEIDVISLLQFEYSGPLINFSFNNVPQLLTVHIHVTQWREREGAICALTMLPHQFPQLESYLVHCSCYIEGLMPERIPSTFGNLKKLVIIEIPLYKRDLLWIATLLKASPLLQKLAMNLHTYEYVEEVREIMRPRRCPHNQLKEFVMTGSRGYVSEIELAVYVFNNAIALETMKIDPNERYYIGDGKWEVSDVPHARATIQRQRFFDQLHREVALSPHVKLVIL